MAFCKITLNTNNGTSRVCIYNEGCNFNCLGCAYKMKSRSGRPAKGGLEREKIVRILAELKPGRVHFIGGEPTLNPDLVRIARFAHEDLGAITKIGHTNGSGRIPEFIDEANFSIKAYDEQLHRMYTGISNRQVLSNFADAYKRGIKLEAGTVMIPGLVSVEEIGRIAEFVAGLDRSISLHITGYIPVPGSPWRSPTASEMEEAMHAAQRHLDRISGRLLDTHGFNELRFKDPSFNSTEVACTSL
ncbi:MAG: radical SAM protein [Candidatus Methanosuratus sp.]|nr:radical SAM protein [Candidatus Methanosuratincola sp.]